MIFDIFSYGLLIYDVNIIMHENVNVIALRKIVYYVHVLNFRDLSNNDIKEVPRSNISFLTNLLDL